MKIKTHATLKMRVQFNRAFIINLTNCNFTTFYDKHQFIQFDTLLVRHTHTYKLTKKSGATGGGDACIADKLKKNKRKNVPRIEKFFLHM